MTNFANDRDPIQSLKSEVKFLRAKAIDNARGRNAATNKIKEVLKFALDVAKTYAASYRTMAKIGNDSRVDCHSVAVDLEQNIGEYLLSNEVFERFGVMIQDSKTKYAVITKTRSYDIPRTDDSRDQNILIENDAITFFDNKDDLIEWINRQSSYAKYKVISYKDIQVKNIVELLEI